MKQPDWPTTAAGHRKAMIKLIQRTSHRYNTWDVFRDFVEMAALSIANAVDLAQREEREARYMRIVGKYSPDDVARFPQLLGHLVEALELEPGDVLGSLFGELELGNAAAGQFFTPYEICRLMAAVTVGDGSLMREQIAERGFITASEPAVGAGAQILALANVMQEKEINYQQHLHVTAVDVDARAVHMAYIQFALLNIPAVVVVGNTLTLEERERWFTPAHILGGWTWRLRLRDRALQQPVEDVTPPLQLEHAPGQLPLFAMDVAA